MDLCPCRAQAHKVDPGLAEAAQAPLLLLALEAEVPVEELASPPADHRAAQVVGKVSISVYYWNIPVANP